MCIGGNDPNDQNHISLGTMTFSYFKPQTKSVQKTDFGMTKEITAGKLERIEYAKGLEIQQISERAMDDLTGASYVSQEEGIIVTSGDNAKQKMADVAVNKMLSDVTKDGGLLDGSTPAVDKKLLDNFNGNHQGGNSPKKDNPNPFDDTTGDPPGIPTNPKGGTYQQRDSSTSISSSGSPNDPTTPEGGCEGDYDFWRPNPEERKFYSSMSSIDLNEFAGSNEMDLLLNAMSVDTMGM